MRQIFFAKGWFLLALWFSFLSISCEEIVDIDLNSAEPRIVVEGIITDGGPPYTVKISQTTDYYNPGEITMISSAQVSVSDNNNNEDYFTEVRPGIYQANFLWGGPGTTYYLNVDVNGKNYQASSTMPEPVMINSLIYTWKDFSFRGKTERRYELICRFSDNPDVENYCCFRLVRNGIPESQYFLYNDRLSNGNRIEYNRFPGVRFEKNDTVRVHLLSIDQPTYEYYSTLNSVLAMDPKGPPSSGVPANPNSNITGGALGYFGAFSARTSSIILRE